MEEAIPSNYFTREIQQWARYTPYILIFTRFHKISSTQKIHVRKTDSEDAPSVLDFGIHRVDSSEVITWFGDRSAMHRWLIGRWAGGSGSEFSTVLTGRNSETIKWKFKKTKFRNAFQHLFKKYSIRGTFHQKNNDTDCSILDNLESCLACQS